MKHTMYLIVYVGRQTYAHKFASFHATATNMSLQEKYEWQLASSTSSFGGAKICKNAIERFKTPKNIHLPFLKNQVVPGNPKTALVVLESMDTFYYHQLSLWHIFGFKQDLRSPIGPHSRNAKWCISKHGNGKTSLELILLLNRRLIIFIAMFICPQKFMWLYACLRARSLLFCFFKSFLA